MFFILSKILDVLLEPLLWVTVCVLVGAAQLARARKRLGLALVLGGVFTLLLFSWGPVSRRLSYALEVDAPNSFKAGETYDAVVLLGGAVDHAGWAPGQPAFNEGVERLLTTFELLRNGRARFAILSGGLGFRGGQTEARVLADQLIAWGVEPERLILEEEAENTRQNATLVAVIVKQRGFASVVIVTSAFHMARAAACFRAVDLPVDTLPVDYQMRDPARSNDMFPRATYLEKSSRAIRELAGRLVYRVSSYAK